MDIVAPNPSTFDSAVVREEIIVVHGISYKVKYLPKNVIAPAYGYAIWGTSEGEEKCAYVREDLPLFMQRFTRSHELYHLRDTATWGGVFGMELRANVVAGIRYPIGFLAVVLATLFTKERLLLYFDRIRHRY